MSNEQRTNYGELSNEQLVARIRAGEDMAGNMKQLLQPGAPLLSMQWPGSTGTAENWKRRDILALYPAIDGYDPAQGVKFLTYAKYHIRQRMRRYLQMNGSCLRIPIHCLEKVQRYKRLCNAFNREYGRVPSGREAATLMRITLEQIEDKGKCMYGPPGEPGQSCKGPGRWGGYNSGGHGSLC